MATVRESSITYIRDDKRIRYYSNYVPEVNKMVKLLEQYPNEVKIVLDYRNVTEENKDLYGFEIECPASWYKMPKPKTTRELTPEQKEKQREILANARANK